MNQPTHDYRCEIDDLLARVSNLSERIEDMRAELEHARDQTPPHGIERPIVPMHAQAQRLAATTAAFTALFKLAGHFDDVDEWYSVTHELSRDAWGSRPMTVRRAEPSPHAPRFDLRGDRS